MKTTLILVGAALAVAGAAVAGLWYVLKQKRGSEAEGDGEWPFVLRPLMSSPEQALYARLVAALPEHVVLAQVQVSRVLDVKKGANRQAWNNRINRMSYDFVVCTPDSHPIAVIELDDASHQRADRQAADAKKDRATAAAGLRTIRWAVSQMPDEEAIRREVLGQRSARLRGTGADLGSGATRNAHWCPGACAEPSTVASCAMPSPGECAMQCATALVTPGHGRARRGATDASRIGYRRRRVNEIDALGHRLGPLAQRPAPTSSRSSPTRRCQRPLSARLGFSRRLRPGRHSVARGIA